MRVVLLMSQRADSRDRNSSREVVRRDVSGEVQRLDTRIVDRMIDAFHEGCEPSLHLRDGRVRVGYSARRGRERCRRDWWSQALGLELACRGLGNNWRGNHCDGLIVARHRRRTA